MACDSRFHSGHRRSPRGVRTRLGAGQLALLLAVLWLCASAAGLHADAEEGGKIFLAKCATCHTIGRGSGIGPDLAGVTEQRDPAWLSRWIQEPDEMLEENDPLAVQLFNDFDRVAMPSSGLDKAQVESVIDYLKRQSAEAGSAGAVPRLPPSAAPDDLQMGGVQALALAVFALISVIIIAVFAFVARSTATPHGVDMKAAYKLRRVLFISGSAAVLILLAITLPNNPYNIRAEQTDEIVYATARQFSFTYSREPVTSVEELGRVATLPVLEISAGTVVEFRVTSLDATHAFGVYDPKGAVVAQTQAMPGYVNRLRLRFGEAGRYAVLCLEYCGVAHHIMRSAIVVR